VLVEVVVGEQVAVRAVGECRLHKSSGSNDEEFFGVLAIDEGVGDLFRVDDVDVHVVAYFYAQFFQFRPGNVDPA